MAVADHTALVAARVTPAEQNAAWRDKAAGVGVSPYALLREAMARTRTWTAPARAIEHERTWQIPRIANNLNQLARWVYTHKTAADYLLGKRAAAGRPRKGVEFHRGDPHQVPAMARGMPEAPMTASVDVLIGLKTPFLEGSLVRSDPWGGWDGSAHPKPPRCHARHRKRWVAPVTAAPSHAPPPPHRP